MKPAIITIILIMIIIYFIVAEIFSEVWISHAPCSDLSNLDVKSLPARCLNYYQK